MIKYRLKYKNCLSKDVKLILHHGPHIYCIFTIHSLVLSALLLQDGVRICPVASEIVLSIFLASLHHTETWSHNSWSPAGWMDSQALRFKAHKSTTRCQTGISGR